MWYAISKFMKWDMLSRICDVVWNDGWSLKYGLYTYVWELYHLMWIGMNCDMMWSEYMNGVNWWIVIWVWYVYGNVLWMC